MLDSRQRGRGFKPHRRQCLVSLSKNINPSLVLVQPRKTRPFITERLLMGCKESNQTKTLNLHCVILKRDLAFGGNINVLFSIGWKLIFVNLASSILFAGQRQTVQNQIGYSKTWHLIRFSIVCVRKILLKFE